MVEHQTDQNLYEYLSNIYIGECFEPMFHCLTIIISSDILGTILKIFTCLPNLSSVLEQQTDQHLSNIYIGECFLLSIKNE